MTIPLAFISECSFQDLITWFLILFNKYKKEINEQTSASLGIFTCEK